MSKISDNLIPLPMIQGMFQRPTPKELKEKYIENVVSKQFPISAENRDKIITYIKGQCHKDIDNLVSYIREHLAKGESLEKLLVG